MKISRRGWIPQLEPEGRLGSWLVRLGAAKMLFQRSGVIANKITMVGALTAAWGTNPTVRELFFHSFVLFIGSAFVAIGLYAAIDHFMILPGEQGYTQEQAHTSERSPLKRDTERIINHIENESCCVRPDGGESSERNGDK